MELKPSVFPTWMQIGRYVLVVNHKVTIYGYKKAEVGSIFKIHAAENRGENLCWPKHAKIGVWQSECMPATKNVMRFYGKKTYKARKKKNKRTKNQKAAN